MLDATALLRGYAKLRHTKVAWRTAAEHQRRQLLALVSQAAGTAFGRDHGFSTIKTVEDYQRQVPLRDFEAFKREYFDAAFPVLTDVTWPGTIPYFAASSGTSSGRTKHIPVSAAMLRSNNRAGTDLLAHHVRARPDSNVLAGKSFMLGGSVAMETLADGVKVGDLSGIARLERPRWGESFVFPSMEEALDADWESKIDKLARLSLREDIRVLASTPSWLLLFLDRLAEITGRTGAARDFYPHLDLMVYGGMSFAPYRDAFRRWFPEGANGEVDWREVYSASEGFVASADRGVDDGLALNLDIGLFFEFVPVADLEATEPQRYWVGNAPAGEYALIMTTCAGLWSYIIGDTVEFIPGTMPRVKVTGRTSYYLSAFGEHLSAAELERAVLTASDVIGEQVSEYAVTALYPDSNRSAGQHLFVVELHSGDPGAAARAQFESVLDQTLAGNNEDYQVHRDKDYQLLPPAVVFCGAGAFADWMRERGKLGGQNKVPRVALKDPVRSDLMRLASQWGPVSEDTHG